MSRNRKAKFRYFPGAKGKDMHHYAVPLQEKKPENIILRVGTNGYKSGTNILKYLIELKEFILVKLPSCKKLTSFSPTVRTNKHSRKKNSEIFTNRLKEPGAPHTTHESIVHKRFYQDNLHLSLGQFA